MGYAEIIKLAFSVITEIVELARQGISKEEIFERMKQPGSVASDLIDAVKKREEDGSEYLGRD